MDLMTIGTFAVRTRLSPKALRLYDRLGLVPPVRTDPVSGYRFYSEEQVAGARLVALLRRLGMPLPVIAEITAKPAGEASEAIAAYWAGVESVTAERRVLVSYIQARLTGGDMTSYDIQTRTIGERTLLSISRHLHLAETDAFFGDAFARLRAGGPGVEGIAGCPFLVFYGEVSEDSDGPLELCRPVSSVDAGASEAAGVQVRVEPGHDEVFIRVAMKDMGWPALMPAVDALEAWIREQRREPAGALRQVLIADQRTAAPDTPVCDLSVPLRLGCAYGVIVAMKLAVVVRADLDMGRGKIAAQVAHAAVGAVLASLGTDDLAAWLRDGQPKVVLKVASLGQLEDVIQQAGAAGLPVETVADAGRTQVAPGTLTCCAVGPAENERVDAITAGLPLL